MTQDEIIRLAREAGYNAQISNEHFGSICYISQDNPDSTTEKFNRLEAFAKLVAQHEREACAGIVVNEAMQYAEPVWAFEIVNDIKARGQA